MTRYLLEVLVGTVWIPIADFFIPACAKDYAEHFCQHNLSYRITPRIDR